MAKGTIGNVSVTPHWDKKPQRFQSIYAHEPMNLWPGWSHENQRNNSEMLDLHFVNVHPGGVLTNDLGGMTIDVDDETENFLMAERLFPEDRSNREAWLRTSKIQEQHTPYSKVFHTSKAEARIAKLVHGTTKKNYRAEQVTKKFAKLKTMLESTTEAGEKHYDQLIGNMKKNGFDSDDDYIEKLEEAKRKWTLARESMISDLTKINDSLTKYSKMTLNHT